MELVVILAVITAAFFGGIYSLKRKFDKMPSFQLGLLLFEWNDYSSFGILLGLFGVHKPNYMLRKAAKVYITLFPRTYDHISWALLMGLEAVKKTFEKP